MSKKIMWLTDKSSSLLECRVCGNVQAASIRPQSNGKFYRGSWQCRNGCKLDGSTAGIQRP